MHKAKYLQKIDTEQTKNDYISMATILKKCFYDWEAVGQITKDYKYYHEFKEEIEKWFLTLQRR